MTRDDWLELGGFGLLAIAAFLWLGWPAGIGVVAVYCILAANS